MVTQKEKIAGNYEGTPAEKKSIEPKEMSKAEPVLTGLEQARLAMKEIVDKSRWGHKGRE
jgi:hypothetical protein